MELLSLVERKNSYYRTVIKNTKKKREKWNTREGVNGDWKLRVGFLFDEVRSGAGSSESS